MKDLIQFQNNLKGLGIDELLIKLETEIKEREYCRLCAHNESLVLSHDNKILFIKMAIVEKHEKLKDLYADLCTDNK